MNASTPFSLYMVGGCGEFGRNCMMLEQGGAALVVDCGSQFPDNPAFDVSCMVPHPDVWEQLPAPGAYVLTHGHEDHVGAVHHALAHAPAPVYGTRFTLRLIAERVAQLPPSVRRASPMVELVPGKRVELPGGIPCMPVAVTHSIPQSLALVLDFPVGPVVHTGDFKLAPPAPWHRDFLHVPASLDLVEEIRMHLQGRLPFLMLADSTGACTPLDSPPEETLSVPIEELMARVEGRLFVTLFSSHIERARHFLRIGAKFGRQAAPLGRSMERYLDVARGEDLLPEANLTTLDKVCELPPDRQMFFITGSQGEMASALDRFSADTHQAIRPQPSDTVVFSASVIPGRERAVGRVMDRLAAAGVRVLWHSEDAPTHVSGHGSRAELHRLFSELAPRNVIPVHGSRLHLELARDAALAAGIAESFVVPDGFRAVWDGVTWRQEECPIDAVLHLENPGDSPLGPESLRFRKKAAASGVVFITARLARRGAVDLKITLAGVGDETRHAVWEREAAAAILEALSREGMQEPERTLDFAVKRFFKAETGKKPQVVVHWMD